jgi:hypothetical protein
MFGVEMNAMLPALVVGCAVAGFIQVAVSRDLLLTLGQNPVWPVLALMDLVRNRYLLNGRRLLRPLTRIIVHPGRGGRLPRVRSDDRHQDAGVAAYHVHGLDTHPSDHGGGSLDSSNRVGGQPCALKMFSVTGAGLVSLWWAS